MASPIDRVVTNLIEQIVNRGDLKWIDDLVAEHTVDHGPSLIGMSGGRAGFTHVVEALRSGLLDLVFTIDESVASGDRVSVHWTLSGMLPGAHEAGQETRRVSTTGTNIYRLEEGKIHESWGNWDALGMMIQLGMVPSPAARPLDPLEVFSTRSS
jgi:predicted ester cyclase